MLEAVEALARPAARLLRAEKMKIVRVHCEYVKYMGVISRPEAWPLFASKKFLR